MILDKKELSNANDIDKILHCYCMLLLFRKQKIMPLRTSNQAVEDKHSLTVGSTDCDNSINNEHLDDTHMRINYRIVEGIESGQRMTTMEMNVNTDRDIGPIVGYAEVPLLPLAKACTPLVSIIYNLLFYVQLAIDETPEVPPDGLTIDESASIRLCSMLNQSLKTADRKTLEPYFKYLKLFLTAVVKLPCIRTQTIWRGVTKDLSGDFPPGTPVTWWAFSSCTLTMTVLNNSIYLGKTGPRTLLSIETINGRTIRAHSHFANEDEILLPPGTHMIVQSQLNPAPDLYIVHLKQVIPDQTLLELPFKGNSIIYCHIIYIQFNFSSLYF